MTSSPREKKSHTSDRGEPSIMEVRREPEGSRQLVRPKSRKPIDRYEDQDSDFGDAMDRSLYDRNSASQIFNPITSSPVERGRTLSRRSDAYDLSGQPISRSLSEKPSYSRSLFQNERSQTSPERPRASQEPQNISLGRISPILNGRGSPRGTEEKLVKMRSFKISSESPFLNNCTVVFQIFLSSFVVCFLPRLPPTSTWGWETSKIQHLKYMYMKYMYIALSISFY